MTISYHIHVFLQNHLNGFIEMGEKNIFAFPTFMTVFLIRTFVWVPLMYRESLQAHMCAVICNETWIAYNKRRRGITSIFEGLSALEVEYMGSRRCRRKKVSDHAIKSHSLYEIWNRSANSIQLTPIKRWILPWVVAWLFSLNSRYF